MTFRCQNDYAICSYKYEPCKGDPENGLSPGTPLNEVPNDWICPRCMTGNDQSKKTRANPVFEKSI